MKKKIRMTNAIIFALLLLTEVLIALFVRDRFIRPYVGDMLVTVLICSFVRTLVPSGLRLLPVYVFLFAAAVEIGQYFDIVKLLGLDGSAFLSTLIGRSFSFMDLVCFAVGCAVFFGIDRYLCRRLHS